MAEDLSKAISTLAGGEKMEDWDYRSSDDEDGDNEENY